MAYGACGSGQRSSFALDTDQRIPRGDNSRLVRCAIAFDGNSATAIFASNQMTFCRLSRPMMLPTLFSKSRLVRPILLTTLAVLCFSGRSLSAQTQAARPIQSQQLAGLPAMHDPTQPEVQPRLDVDHDPIPTPDAEENPSTNSRLPSTTNQARTLQRGQNGIYTLNAEVDEVLLNCTVIDEKGRTVNGLTQGDFRVWEDGVPQTINSVQHQDLPVSLGILVDNSGSMRDKRAAVNTAAFNLLRDSNPKDEAFIVNFSDRAFLDQDFTSDLDALDRGSRVSIQEASRRCTMQWPLLPNELSKHANRRKQVLLIITDGADNASRLDLKEAIRRVQDLGGPVVYSIGMLFDTDPEETDRARKALETLSEETGGIAYFPRSLQEVNGSRQRLRAIFATSTRSTIARPSQRAWGHIG